MAGVRLGKASPRRSKGSLTRQGIRYDWVRYDERITIEGEETRQVGRDQILLSKKLGAQPVRGRPKCFHEGHELGWWARLGQWRGGRGRDTKKL